jgi:hypothetical protein
LGGITPKTWREMRFLSLFNLPGKKLKAKGQLIYPKNFCTILTVFLTLQMAGSLKTFFFGLLKPTGRKRDNLFEKVSPFNPHAPPLGAWHHET